MTYDRSLCVGSYHGVQCPLRDACWRFVGLVEGARWYSEPVNFDENSGCDLFFGDDGK
jgi:hypothetical protein